LVILESRAFGTWGFRIILSPVDPASGHHVRGGLRRLRVSRYLRVHRGHKKQNTQPDDVRLG
jgi:hypothetical protein